MPPSKRKMLVFVQICTLIPRNLMSKLARKHGVDKRRRDFDPRSHKAFRQLPRLGEAQDEDGSALIFR